MVGNILIDNIRYDRERIEAGLHVLGLAPRLAEPVAVGQHHGAHRRGDQQRRGGG